MKKTKPLVFYLRIIAVFVTLGSIYIFAPWYEGYVYIKPLPDSIQEEIDNVFNYEFDGIIVHIDKAGEAPREYASGWKDRDARIPADPKSLFKIASHRKLFISAAIARLAYNKQLSIEDTIDEYFPELTDKIANMDRIRIRHLTQHRSGIPSFTETPGFWEIQHESEDAVLALIYNLPAEFEPDTDYHYSNTNYLLLTRIITKVSGKDFREYIKEAIIDPLGLKNTYMSISEVNLDDVMSGYYVGIEEDIKSTDYGSMLATAEDLAIFLRALNTGTLFNDEEQAIYTTLYWYEHTGLLPGYQSLSTYNRDTDTVIVLFVNTANFMGNTWVMAEVLFSRIKRISEKAATE